MVGGDVNTSAVPAGMVLLPAQGSVTDAWTRLEAAVAEHGITIFARIDFAADAAAVGMHLRPTRLLVFGNPRAGTPLLAPLMAARPLMNEWRALMYGISRHSLKIIAAAGGLSLLAGGPAFGQVLQGDAAVGSWRDDKPGVRRLLTPQDLPAVSKPTYGVAQVVPVPAGAQPQVPDGFKAERVTTDPRKPRVIRVAPNGDLFVADSMFNSVRVLRVP